MIKFLKRVIISIIILFCAVISLLTGERIFKTFAGAINYMDCTEEQLNNRFLSVEFEEISPLAMNYNDRSCYVGKTYDGRMVLVLKDTADDEGLTPHTLLKGMFIVSTAAVNDVKKNMTDENEKAKYMTELTKYAFTVTDNPYNLTVSTFVQFILGILIVIAAVFFKIKIRLSKER